MYEPTIIAMLRLKNEERWIKKTLETLSEICNGMVIVDDGSIDNTVKICETFPKVVEIHKQANLPYDEVRDKNTLLKMALKQNSDYLLFIDGDEVIHPKLKNILFEELSILYPESDVFEFQSLFVWDRPNQYRYDGMYSNVWQRRLFRLKNQPKDLKYEGTPFPKNLHSPHIPQKTVGFHNPVKSRVKILHYGYYDENLRHSKYDSYVSMDPYNTIFDAYKHTISSEGKLSGPRGMEFKTIPDGMYISDIK